MKSIIFRKIVAVYLIPELCHGDSEEWNSFRIEVIEEGRSFKALIYYMEHYNMELSQPIAIEGKESSLVGSSVYVFDDYLSNHPVELAANSVDNVLEHVSERLSSNGYKCR